MTTPNLTIESRLDTPLKRWIPINAETLLVLVILALAVISRFYGLGDRAISHDEVNHVIPAYDLYSGHGYRYDPLSHGPLQFHMMAFSYTLFGDNDFTSRIPAAVFSVATILLALLLFKPYLGRIGTLAAGVMFLISPYMLFYGRYERNEAFIVVWGLLTIYSILRYLEKGEKRILFLFTLINAFHFTDKATSYIFAAEELLFLAGYFLDRLIRREWPESRWKRNFVVTFIISIVLFAAAAVFYLVQKSAGASLPAGEATAPSSNTTMLIAVGSLVVLGLAALVFSAVAVVKGLGWERIRQERSFDLLMLLGTLVIPLLATLAIKLFNLLAIPVLAKMNVTVIPIDPLDYSAGGMMRTLAFIVPMAAIAAVLGLWWNRRSWLYFAAVFFTPFVLLYSTFFTNPTGIMGGFVGALGYWFGQERGGQPLYYYALVQIPVYEFLPAVGTITAVVIAIARRLWQSEPGEPFVSGRSREGEHQAVPTVALTFFWTVSSLVAFSLAGEKMPWLTIHIALPMILAAGWAVGWLSETISWQRVREWTGRYFARAAMLGFLGLLGLVTVRTSFKAAYINYDYPYEFLVYAHAAPDPKMLYNEIVELSRRITGGMDLVVAYDNNARYSYWWYMRRFPNRIDFDTTPTLDVRRAPVIAVSAENYDKIAPVVRNDYVEADYMRLWWPAEDYKNISWNSIGSEFAADQGVDAKTMTLGEYLKYAWKHISPFFTDPKVRSAVWQIWFNRDFTQWAALRSSDSYTLTNWGVSDRMRLYIRKDIASQIWTYGAAAQPVSPSVDPYLALTLPLSPDRVIGTVGTEPGQFQSPRSMAVAPDGSLYVADAGNNRIQHLSPEGGVIQVWGSFADVSQGNAPGGTFNEPWGVAVGPDGSVYVSDTWNHRIQKFTADGQFVKMWGHGPAEDLGAFYGPRGIAVDRYGHVLVADTGNKRILIYDSDGNLLGQFGSPGFDAGQFDEPVGIALDQTGRVYVTDTWNQRVQVFVPDSSGLYFTPEKQWPVDGWYGQSLENKPFLAVDGQQDTFVTDPEACRVVEFSSDGTALHAWGSCGQPDSFVLPDGLALDASGGLWVADAGAGKLFHYFPTTP